MQTKINRFGIQKLFKFMWNTAAALGLLVVLVTVTPIVGWLGREYAGRWTDPAGDVLIVLGGAGFDDGVIAENTLLRSQYAARSFKQRGFKTIVVVGGGQVAPAAQAMRNYLICQGVPPGAVLIEERSLSTYENALFAKEVLAPLPGRKVLLTSDYHMYRAGRVFAKLGIVVEPNPIPDVIKRSTHWQRRWPAFLDMVLETVKIAYYRGRGWI